MNVVVLVAADAVPLCVAKLDLRFVTVLALRVEMRFDQFKISECVIEAVFVKVHDVCTATVMIGVTAGAVIVPRIRKQAVKAAFRRDVGSNVLVAVQAQRPLLIAIEGLVTRRTIFFDVRVTLDEFAGHDQRLDLRECDIGGDQS